MRAPRDCAQQLLLPASAGIDGGTRASETARPDFHRPSRLRQPPAPGGAVARGDFGWPPARPAADGEARVVGGQAQAEHQRAASRAQGLPLPSARQDDRLGNPTSAVLAAVEHADRGVLRRSAERGSRPVRQARHLQYRSEPALAKAGGRNSPARSSPRYYGIMGSRSAWTDAGAATTTS